MATQGGQGRMRTERTIDLGHITLLVSMGGGLWGSQVKFNSNQKSGILVRSMGVHKEKAVGGRGDC